MKRIAIVVLAASVFAAVSMAASWTGWVSDEKCGAKGANAEHADCAKTCIKAGMKPVLATDDGQVFKIANPDKVTQYAGEKVVVTGAETGGVIQVQKVKPVAKPGSSS
jgi:Protein of unknown function (DUF5818)